MWVDGKKKSNGYSGPFAVDTVKDIADHAYEDALGYNEGQFSDNPGIRKNCWGAEPLSSDAGVRLLYEISPFAVGQFCDEAGGVGKPFFFVRGEEGVEVKNARQKNNKSEEQDDNCVFRKHKMS